MRIPLVPSAIVFGGLALIAAPPFFPIHVDQAVLPEGMTIERTLEIVGLPIVLAGFLTTSAGILLVSRGSPSASRLSARICTGIAALVLVAALLLAAAVPALMVEWGMTPALGAASALSYLLGVPLLFAALLLVRRHLIGRSADRTGTATLCTAIALTALTATPALAISLGDMAQQAGEDLDTVPFLISVAFWIVGVLIVGFGLLRLKRHVDHPSQTTIGSGLVAVLIGAALLVAPAVINAVGDTFGVDSTATITRPALD